MQQLHRRQGQCAAAHSAVTTVALDTEPEVVSQAAFVLARNASSTTSPSSSGSSPGFDIFEPGGPRVEIARVRTAAAPPPTRAERATRSA